MVEFMQPHGPQKNFKWPRKQHRCLVPIQSVLCTVSPPATTTGRIYQITDKEYDDIVKSHQCFLQKSV